MKSRAVKYLKYGGITLLLLVIVTGISAEYTSRSSFCNSCHYMEPFYIAWETSSHSEVDCVTCHYPPSLSGKIEGKFRGLIQLVNYVGQTYKRSKPWAEIPDTSCLQSGCHAKRLLSGKVAFKKIIFDHSDHLGDLKRGKQLRCTSCHSQIVQGDHMSVTESTCFLCHFKDKRDAEIERSCVSCHDWGDVIENESMGEFAYDHTEIHESNTSCKLCHTNVVIGDGAVPHENCYQCHFERDRLNLFDDTDLMHTKHIAENKIECQNCHLTIQHKIQPLSVENGTPDCTTCHTNWHQEQLRLFTGTGGLNVHSIPNPMYTVGLNCKGCHIFHESNVGSGTGLAKTDRANSESCEQCHGKGFERILRNWEEVTDSRLEKIESAYGSLASAIKLSEPEDETRSKVNKLLDEAMFNIQLVKKGKSVHNIAYSEQLLKASFASISQAASLTGQQVENLEFIEREVEIPSECSTCHFGIEEKEKPIFGLTFKHEVHVAVNGMKCYTCHSNAVRHGQLIMTKDGCAQCHHNNDTVDCRHCHELQSSVLEGSPAFYGSNVEGVMSMFAEDCLVCHEIEDKRVKRPVGETCVACHEEGYELVLHDWKTEAEEQLNLLENELDERIKNSGNIDKNRLLEMKTWISKLRDDGSKSVHNRALFADVISTIEDYIKK